MADSSERRDGKPPAITVRCASWEDYEWITAAAAKRDMSRGEFLLAGALQRRTGGPMPKSRKELARTARENGRLDAAQRVRSSAEAKADVRPIPKGGKRRG